MPGIVRYYADTEFEESTRDGSTRLISIGVCCDDGRELHLANRFVSVNGLGEWHQKHVVPHLPPFNDKDAWLSPPEIRDRLVEFFGARDGKPELWMYYGAYDWMLICKLFGRMIDLPKSGFPRYYRDLKDLADSLGDIRLPMKPMDAHSALADARWNRDSHRFLLERQKAGL